MTAQVHADFQAGFAAALTARDTDAAPRFRVYRNNYFHGLSELLAEAYPVVRQLVGDPFFFAIAREFIASYPPRSRTLVLYGTELPDFLQAFPPAAALAYLPDVARLERAWLEALHSADQAPLEPDILTGLGPRLAKTRFIAHPATRIIMSTHPIAEIWQAHRPGVIPNAGRPDVGGQGALVTRPRLWVEVRALGVAEATFARALCIGDDASTAHERARGADEHFDITQAFRLLVAAGAFMSRQSPAVETHTRIDRS